MSQRVNKQRLTWMRYSTVALFGIAALSQGKVQILDRNAIVDRAQKSDRFRVARTDNAHRGEILSSDGKILATDIDGRQLTVDFKKVPKSRGFYMALSAASGIPASEFALRADSEKAVTWERAFTSSEAAAINAVKRDWRADGVGMSSMGARVYEMGPSAAGVVGYIHQDKPAGGIELGQNALLTGESGKTVGMVDKDGQYLPMRLDRETKKRVDGKQITLTINSRLQSDAYDAVKEAVEANKADRGIAIVASPQGDILAMANYPSFDPNLPLPPVEKGKPSADLTPSYQASLEPGSTFKIITVAKAMDMGLIQRHSYMNCPGTIEVSGRMVRCDSHGGNRAHGKIDSEDAIARSCNVSAANWAMKIGYENFIPYIEDLGLLRRPGLGLPRESKGLFDYSEVAKKLQVANVGFGQSISVTPVALTSAFCMLANEGRSVKPRIIERIGTKEAVREPGKQIIKPETAQEVLGMMRAVIDSDHGTGKALRISGFDLGGKTGTAQKVNAANKTMSGGGYVSNFVGYVPAEKPQAVILVMVDNPKAGKIYGGSVAGPVFVKIARSAIDKLGIEPTRASEKPKVIIPSSVSHSENSVPEPRLEVIAREVKPWKTPAEVESERPKQVVAKVVKQNRSEMLGDSEIHELLQSARLIAGSATQKSKSLKNQPAEEKKVVVAKKIEAPAKKDVESKPASLRFLTHDLSTVKSTKTAKSVAKTDAQPKSKSVVVKKVEKNEPKEAPKKRLAVASKTNTDSPVDQIKKQALAKIPAKVAVKTVSQRVNKRQ